MKKHTREEQAFIEGTELAIDWGLPIPDEDFEKYIELTKEGVTKIMEEKNLYRIYIELNSDKDIEEFTNICSQIPEEVTMRGKDEYGSEWMLSAKSLLCSLIMSTKLQKHRKHNAHELDWNTIYVECERDIYSLISKFAI